VTVKVLQGDCRKVLATLPAASVHTIVTSPPYYGLRDYGVDGQIGLEQTPDAYVAEMVAVFREAKRVLRDDGTLWLNLGDCYNANQGNGFDTNKDGGARKKAAASPKVSSGGLPPKNLLMIPARVALALQADGWYLRSEIIWAKPNPMPESVRDRPTSAHEKVYLFAKQPRYFYDADAVREPLASATLNDKRLGATGTGRHRYSADGMAACPSGFTGANLSGRNLRNVWTITPKPFKGAHFAVFPPALVEPCIKAGCPEGGTVLDPFGGSGTTGLVANSLGRNAVLIELNPTYAAMAQERLAA
jgi:DNA modification methylase